MNEHTNLSSQFLIAMPALSDPNFHQTVTLICEHSDQGALGIVINRPLQLRLGDIFEQLALDDTGQNPLSDQIVLSGGPVGQERGFVLHERGSKWDSTMMISPEIAVTTSRDILAAMARGDGPDGAIIALGYAGWAAGQLEAEISANAWLSVPANNDIIFRLPYEQRREAAAALLGVNLDLLSTEAGHA